MTPPRPLQHWRVALRLDALAAQFGRFLGVGLAGMSTDMAAFTALHALHATPTAARAASIGLATVVTWTLNRRFTFDLSGRARRAEAGRYAAVVVLAQGTSYAAFLILVAAAPQLAPQAAIFAGAVVATGFSFIGQRFFTFAARPQESAQ